VLELGCGLESELPAGTLPELFATQVARTPGAVAVAAAGAELTYAELAARAGGLARRLVELGVLPDRPVGLLVERSADLVVAELAVALAGGCTCRWTPEPRPTGCGSSWPDPARVC